MEKYTLYDNRKLAILQKANDMIREGKMGANSITPQYVVDHLDEYALREVIHISNGIASRAQQISNRIDLDPANVQSIKEDCLRIGPDGEKMFSEIMDSRGKQINLEEDIRQKYFSLSGAPNNFRLPTYQEISLFEKKVAEEYAQMRANPELRYDYDFYSKYLDDFYNLKKMQSISSGINGNVFNTESVSELDQAKAEKLQEFEQMIIEKQHSSGYGK